MQKQLPILLVAAFLSTPSSAQWFSDLPAQCPVGTALSSKGTCVKSVGRPAAKQTASLPRKAPVPAGSAAPAQVKLPSGAEWKKACSNFNGGFSGWYRAQAAEYEDLAKRNRDEESAMARNIDRQRELERDLRRQVFRARQSGVRKELTAQWNAVRRDLAANTKHLAATKTKNRAAEAKWKGSFKGRLQEKLETRPAGCAVRAASSKGK